jgi:hypothetical protein
VGYLDAINGAFGIRSVDGLDVNVVENIMLELFQEIKLPFKILVNDIYSEIVLNQSHLLIKKLDYYGKLCNIKSIVVADFTILNILNKEDTEYDFCLSTNAYRNVNELFQTLMLNDEDNITEIVINRDLNRDVESVKLLDKHRLTKNMKKVLMVNEGCVLNCPYRESGDIEISLSTGHFNIHHHGCRVIKNKHPWMFLTSPFMTKSMVESSPYDNKILKIAGRNKETAYIKGIMDYYIDGTDLPLSEFNNLNQIPNISMNSLDAHDTFTKDVIDCDKVCANCRKCETIYKDLT